MVVGKRATFEWDDNKATANEEKHGLTFYNAQEAFFDPDRVIAEDISHSKNEKRYYCFGKVGNGIATVRFTYRGKKIRIIGAGYWRAGRKAYDKEKNKV